jgi:hypothetical protein
VQSIFETKQVIKLRSAELLEALNADPEMAWPTYNRGQPLSVRQLAKLLAGYDIKPRTVRLDKHKTYKGYYRDDFADAFARYLTPGNDPDQRHIAPQALPTEAVAVPDSQPGIRIATDDPDRAAVEAEADELIDTFQGEYAGTPQSSPALGRSGDTDAVGKGE